MSQFCGWLVLCHFGSCSGTSNLLHSVTWYLFIGHVPAPLLCTCYGRSSATSCRLLTSSRPFTTLPFYTSQVASASSTQNKMRSSKTLPQQHGQRRLHARQRTAGSLVETCWLRRDGTGRCIDGGGKHGLIWSGTHLLHGRHHPPASAFLQPPPALLILQAALRTGTEGRG